MPVHMFKVEMTCNGCANAVQKVLSKLGDKIENIDFDVDNKLVLVTSDLDGAEILSVIEKTGKQTEYNGIKQ